MHRPFEFEDGGRTYTCGVETGALTPGEAWWWFTVSGDRQRYAPFRASPGEARGSVQSRVIAYYASRLARLAEPATFRRWGRRYTPAPAISPIVSPAAS